MGKVLSMIVTAIAVLIALVLHEFAHGFVSYKLGDPTPKEQGRLTLNPLAHLDLMGTICLLFFHMGWAKPVAINYNYYKNKKLGTALVALAGPFMNFLIAIIAGIIFYTLPESMIGGLFSQFIAILYIINIGLGSFNLIPLPPLDGSKVLAAILPEKVYDKYMTIEQYGMFILFGLLFTGILDPYLVVWQNIMNSVVQFIVYSII